MDVLIFSRVSKFIYLLNLTSGARTHVGSCRQAVWTHCFASLAVEPHADLEHAAATQSVDGKDPVGPFSSGMGGVLERPDTLQMQTRTASTWRSLADVSGPLVSGSQFIAASLPLG